MRRPKYRPEEAKPAVQAEPVTLKDIVSAVETLQKHNQPKAFGHYVMVPPGVKLRNDNGWSVQFVHVDARGVITVRPDDPIWREDPADTYGDLQTGFIAKLEPPTGANVDAVRSKLLAEGALQIVTAPAMKADRPVPLESIDSKMGPQRSIREVTGEMVQDVDASIRDRVAAEVEELLTAEGL